MELPAFLPEDLRQLARFVPARGWDAVEWASMMGSLRSLSWRFVSGSGVRQQTQRTSAVADRVILGRPPRDATSLEGLTHAAQKRSAGDRILQMYFRQWLLEDGLFIDLRPARFWWAERKLYFQPNGLWLKLRPEFRNGMVNLYRAFYSEDEVALRGALSAMGMLRPGLSAASETELLDLLRIHFGMQAGAQHFSINEFKASFDRLFDFFLAHDYRLHSDFVFVGFYLITLYLSLEAGGQEHDVRTLCMSALEP